MFRTHDYRFSTCKISIGAIYEDDTKFGENTILGSNTVIMENVKIGNNTIIGPLCVIESGTIIGNNVTIQPFCVIARDTIIEDNVFIAPHFSCANDKFIQDGEHGTSKNKKPFKAHRITIKEGARLGTRCTVAPGVTIGKNSFVKMCCFIKKDIPENTIIKAGMTYE
jgi:acetyltransferase-like isoleucine patch superfamily enzyme